MSGEGQVTQDRYLEIAKLNKKASIWTTCFSGIQCVLFVLFVSFRFNVFFALLFYVRPLEILITAFEN